MVAAQQSWSESWQYSLWYSRTCQENSNLRSTDLRQTWNPPVAKWILSALVLTVHGFRTFTCIIDMKWCIHCLTVKCFFVCLFIQCYNPDYQKDRERKEKGKQTNKKQLTTRQYKDKKKQKAHTNDSNKNQRNEMKK